MNSFKNTRSQGDSSKAKALIAGIESSFDYEYRREFEAKTTKALIIVWGTIAISNFTKKIKICLTAISRTDYKRPLTAFLNTLKAF
jgi:hypothetical protein